MRSVGQAGGTQKSSGREVASAKKVMGSGAEGKKSGGEEEEEKGVVS